MEKAEKGKTVGVEYTLTLEGGKVVDENVGKDPLEFEVGSKQIIPGFSDAVEGMTVGQEKQVTIEPENGYGPVRPELVQEIEQKIRASAITSQHTPEDE